ncbi:hypothetical protein NLI96_g8526 [Meripilus lineatus]|uniref:Uncharacterized protein n=1 Tax=Meripilus lineatus TaxID=2056292 RepID=A0AAD5YB22_9APHY|nr:hypothetical protein NLI96_g8526 [Physisporinus lineatus]
MLRNPGVSSVESFKFDGLLWNYIYNVQKAQNVWARSSALERRKRTSETNLTGRISPSSAITRMSILSAKTSP